MTHLLPWVFIIICLEIISKKETKLNGPPSNFKMPCNLLKKVTQSDHQAKNSTFHSAHYRKENQKLRQPLHIWEEKANQHQVEMQVHPLKKPSGPSIRSTPKPFPVPINNLIEADPSTLKDFERPS
ncbi:hypothetical protein JTB14_004449 [Gonioctena quinquepunctata]|nr:hypothetical protein JTB14_004449 [Gonioctena quinquepunctata]